MQKHIKFLFKLENHKKKTKAQGLQFSSVRCLIADISYDKDRSLTQLNMNNETQPNEDHTN